MPLVHAVGTEVGQAGQSRIDAYMRFSEVQDSDCFLNCWEACYFFRCVEPYLSMFQRWTYHVTLFPLYDSSP